ncbi:MAG: OsmC family protein [Bacteroidota bacterium]|nr:OsmC family protein [Bacteroidota bacterium]
MKINLKRLNNNFHMEARNEDGNTIQMDSSPEIGGEGKGMRPRQLLLAAIGGCSAIDVILILKKQKQEISDFDVEVDGESEKVEDYSLFRDITLHFKVKGKVDYDKVERAVKLSIDKYCSVSKTLEPTAKINYKITVN